jgi:hypothetical protein
MNFIYKNRYYIGLVVIVVGFGIMNMEPGKNG